MIDPNARAGTDTAPESGAAPTGGRRGQQGTLAALGKAFAIGAGQPLRQPGTLVGFAIFFVLPPLVLGMVWKVAAQESGGSIVGYDASQLVWYIVMAETAVLTVRNRMIEIIGDDIGSGRITVELQRPISVLGIRLAAEFGFMAPRLLTALVLASGVGLALGGTPPSTRSLALAVPAVLVGLAVNTSWQHLFAAASFWVREAKGAWFIYTKLVFVLGGMLLPLEVLPGWLETVAKALPFMAMVYVPSRLAAGFFEPELILLQLLWLAIGLALASRMFAAGQRHLMRGGGS